MCGNPQSAHRSGTPQSRYKCCRYHVPQKIAGMKLLLGQIVICIAAPRRMSNPSWCNNVTLHRLCQWVNGSFPSSKSHSFIEESPPATERLHTRSCHTKLTTTIQFQNRVAGLSWLELEQVGHHHFHVVSTSLECSPI